MSVNGGVWLTLALLPFLMHMAMPNLSLLLRGVAQPLTSRPCNHTAECAKARQHKASKRDYTAMRIKNKILEVTGKKIRPFTLNINRNSPLVQKAITPPPRIVSRVVQRDIFVHSEDSKTVTNRRMLRFKLRDPAIAYDRYTVLGAELWVYVRKRRRNRRPRRITIRVSTVTNDGKKGDTISKLRLKIEKNDWQKISLRGDLAKALIRNPWKPLLLHIRCKCSRQKGAKVVMRMPRRLRRRVMSEAKIPFIVIRTQTREVVRSRRDLVTAAVNCQANSSIPQCCEHLFYVNFTAQNWSIRVIAPEGFVQTLCRGRCTGSRQTASARRLRCRPIRREDLNVIYIDENHNPGVTVLRRYLKRGCRCSRRPGRTRRRHRARRPRAITYDANR